MVSHGVRVFGVVSLSFNSEKHRVRMFMVRKRLIYNEESLANRTDLETLSLLKIISQMKRSF